MSSKEKLSEMKKKMQEVQKEMAKVAQDAFREESQKLFEENPELKSFGWTQYTPYWCDGEVCEFGAHVDYPTVNGEEDGDYQNQELVKKVADFLRLLDDDDYKNLFGDHVSVKVTPKKVEVTSYEHE